MDKIEAEKRFAERMKRCYPPGTRILLLSMVTTQVLLRIKVSITQQQRQ